MSRRTPPTPIAAKHSRPGAQTVAGYDLTFSPVKSVSTLWALAEKKPLTRGNSVERMTGIEPALSAWEVDWGA
jgi:hypothetical protein